ncbi:MAG TPA: phage minor head protein, partial [Micromonosporaceae bacterium]|nr:phage minor head protein [Micromonosporaceae bacterium]
MASFLDDQTDPWLTTRMRQLAARAEAENLIGEGVFTAIARFLAIARAAVLGEPQERTQPRGVAARIVDVSLGDRAHFFAAPTFQTGEGEDEQLPPPNLDAWPDEQVWLELLATHVIPRIGQTWDIHYGMQTTFDDSRWKFAYLEEVHDRLKIWPRNAFEDIRFELLEGMQQGETIRELRARVGRSLAIDARSRTAQAEINDLTKVIDDPETSPAERKAARARRAELYRSMDIEDAEWQWKAARIARTEAMGAMNGGTYAGARVHEIATGESRWKQWWATSDNRVRDTHWVVHMKVKPLSEPFTVGGFELMHPGQAGGPAHEVINCRCLILVLTLEQAREEEIRYNLYRPGRRNIDGQEMDDNGQPITAPAISMAARRLLGWHTDDAHGRLIATGGWCSPDPHALERTTYAMTTEPIVLPATGAPEPDPATPGDRPLPVGWRGVLAPLNVPSADWRMLLLDTTSEAQTRPLPLPFKFQDEQWGGHDGAFGVGLITKIWREGELLWGSGPFDLADPRAAEIARKVRDGYQGWVSVDLDPPRVAEYRWWKDGAPIDGPDPDGMEVEAYPEWRLSSATLVMDQAFPEAKVYP